MNEQQHHADTPVRRHRLTATERWARVCVGTGISVLATIITVANLVESRGVTWADWVISMAVGALLI